MPLTYDKNRLHVSVLVKIIRMTFLTIWRIYDMIKRLLFPDFSFALVNLYKK